MVPMVGTPGKSLQRPEPSLQKLLSGANEAVIKLYIKNTRAIHILYHSGYIRTRLLCLASVVCPSPKRDKMPLLELISFC